MMANTQPMFAIGDMIKIRDRLYPGISFYGKSKYLILGIKHLSSSTYYEVLNITNGEVNNLSAPFVHDACERIGDGI